MFIINFFTRYTKWNILNVRNISEMFKGCISLCYFPDIYKWKFSSNIIYDNIFESCFSTIYYHDLSPFKTNIISSQKIYNKDYFGSIIKKFKKYE